MTETIATLIAASNQLSGDALAQLPVDQAATLRSSMRSKRMISSDPVSTP